MRIQRNFEITYPLNQKVVRDLKIVTENVGYLSVTGVATINTKAPKTEIDERYSVDIDFMNWNGVDISPVLEVTGGYDDVIEYCVRRVAELFEENQNVRA